MHSQVRKGVGMNGEKGEERREKGEGREGKDESTLNGARCPIAEEDRRPGAELSSAAERTCRSDGRRKGPPSGPR